MERGVLEISERVVTKTAQKSKAASGMCVAKLKDFTPQVHAGSLMGAGRLAGV